MSEQDLYKKIIEMLESRKDWHHLFTETYKVNDMMTGEAAASWLTLNSVIEEMKERLNPDNDPSDNTPKEKYAHWMKDSRNIRMTLAFFIKPKHDPNARPESFLWRPKTGVKSWLSRLLRRT